MPLAALQRFQHIGPMSALNNPLSQGPYLTGQLLLAMPTMGDPRFERSVIYICSHSPQGAMGLMVNRLMAGASFAGLLEQLQLSVEAPVPPLDVLAGGPVEPGRGFVLHSPEYSQGENSRQVGEDVMLTATLDILRDLASGAGPEKALICLGYAGWSPGQLEQEIMANGWLSAPPSANLLFDVPLAHKWPKALDLLGVSISALSQTAGLA